MKLLFVLFFALSALVLSVDNSYGQVIASQPDAASTPAIVKAPTNNDSQSTFESVKRERDLYEKLYNQAKESADATHSDLMTSLWALAGIVLGTVALLIGSQLFSNYRLNKQLLAGFEQRINDSISKIDTSLQVRQNQLSSAILTLEKDTESKLHERIVNINQLQLVITAYDAHHDEQFEMALDFLLKFLESFGKLAGILEYNIISDLNNSINKINVDCLPGYYDRIVKLVSRYEKERLQSNNSNIIPLEGIKENIDRRVREARKID